MSDLYERGILTLPSGGVVHVTGSKPKPRRYPVAGQVVTPEPEERCIAAEAAEAERRRRGMKPDAPIALWISCPCSRCTPR